MIDAVKRFGWLFYENKPFLAEHAPGSYASVILVDFNSDGTKEIVITAGYPPRAVPASEIFSVVDGQLQSVGGFPGYPGATKEENNYDKQCENNFQLITTGKETFILQWAYSSYNGMSCKTLLLIDATTFQYKPVVACVEPYINDGRPQETTYYKISGHENCDTEFLETAIYSQSFNDVEPITEDQFDRLVSELQIDISNIHFDHVVDYNLSHMPSFDSSQEEIKIALSLVNDPNAIETTNSCISEMVKQAY